MPTFDTKPSKRPQKKCIPRYELLGTNNRVTMAVCGKLRWKEPGGAIHVFDGFARIANCWNTYCQQLPRQCLVKKMHL